MVGDRGPRRVAHREDRRGQNGLRVVQGIGGEPVDARPHGRVVLEVRQCRAPWVELVARRELASQGDEPHPRRPVPVVAGVLGGQLEGRVLVALGVSGAAHPDGAAPELETLAPEGGQDAQYVVGHDQRQEPVLGSDHPDPGIGQVPAQEVAELRRRPQRVEIGVPGREPLRIPADIPAVGTVHGAFEVTHGLEGELAPVPDVVGTAVRSPSAQGDGYHAGGVVVLRHERAAAGLSSR